MDISETQPVRSADHLYIHDRLIDGRIIADVANSMRLPTPVKHLLLGTGEFSTWKIDARELVLTNILLGDKPPFTEEQWKKLDPSLQKYSTETILAGMFDTTLASKAMDAVNTFTKRYTGRRAVMRMGIGAALGMTGGNALDTFIHRRVPEREVTPDVTIVDGIEYPVVERVSPIPSDDVLKMAQIVGGGVLGSYAASRTLDQVRFIKTLCDALTLQFASRVSKIHSGEITVGEPSMGRW